MRTEAKLTGKRCQCPACGEYFSTVSNFDRHRKGPMTDRRCVDPASVGLLVRQSGENRFWAMPGRAA